MYHIQLSLQITKLQTEIDLYKKDVLTFFLMDTKSQHSHSKYGLETQLKSLFYLFVRIYAILCTVTEPIVF